MSDVLSDVSGSEARNLVVDGNVTLTGTNIYTGGTTIDAGTLQLGDGTTNGSVTGDITDNAALIFDTSATPPQTYSGVISGSGTVTMAGPGTLILSGENTYAGGTTISAGTLQLGSSGALDGNIYVDGNDATLDLKGYSTTVGNVVLDNNDTIENTGDNDAVLTASSFLVMQGVISADLAGGSLTKITNGTVTL